MRRILHFLLRAIALVMALIRPDVARAGVGAMPDRAYVTDIDANQIVIVNLEDLSIVDRLGVDESPTDVAAARDGSLVAVIAGGVLALVDPATDHLVASVPLGAELGFRGVAVAHDGAKIYVGDRNSNRLLVVDRDLALSDPAHAITVFIPVFAPPTAIGLSPSGNEAYVTTDAQATQSNTVAVLDLETKTLVGNVAVGQQPLAARYTPNGAFVWVADLGDVFVLDTSSRTVARQIVFGRDGGLEVANLDVAISPDGAKAYVAGGVLGVFDTSTYALVDSLDSLFAHTLAISRDGETLYAATGNDGNLLSIDAATVEIVETSPIGIRLEDIALVEADGAPTETPTASPTPTGTPAAGGGGGGGCAAGEGGSPSFVLAASALLAVFLRGNDRRARSPL